MDYIELLPEVLEELTELYEYGDYIYATDPVWFFKLLIKEITENRKKNIIKKIEQNLNTQNYETFLIMEEMVNIFKNYCKLKMVQDKSKIKLDYIWEDKTKKTKYINLQKTLKNKF
jgi:uncharacterized protein YjaG (DUF416 family)